jgi:serine/threonine protein kinase
LTEGLIELKIPENAGAVLAVSLDNHLKTIKKSDFSLDDYPKLKEHFPRDRVRFTQRAKSLETQVQPGQIIAEKYRIERILGQGGMGVVAAAWHLELEQLVAVKFLLPELASTTDAEQRFRREARAAVKIRSEHVARVMDVGKLEDGTPYMVMEYLEGSDLSELMRTGYQLPLEEVVEIILQAAEAIAEAHSVGIVHRDLKPANLFVTARADGSRCVKVLDFGISKTRGQGGMAEMSLTRTTALIGSPLYMSPEQMDSPKNVDERTDIWSLGVIIYEFLAGRPPFVAETIPRLCAAMMHETPPSLTEFRPDIDQGLNDIVMRCLSKTREERWQTVADLAEALIPYGTPQSMYSAERAMRVLGSQPRSMVGSAQSFPGRVSMVGRSEVISIIGASSSGVGHTSENSSSQARPQGPHAPARTVASWGTTGEEEKPRGNSKRLMGVALIGAAASVIVVGLLLLAFRSPTVAANQQNAGQPPKAEQPTATSNKVTVQPTNLPTPPPPAATAKVTPVDSVTTPETKPSATSKPEVKAKPPVAQPHHVYHYPPKTTKTANPTDGFGGRQ